VEDEGGGVVAHFGDAAELAKQIDQLLNNPQARRVMGERGQKVAESYDGEVLWARNAEVLERVVS